jgi:hypothetical protein
LKGSLGKHCDVVTVSSSNDQNISSPQLKLLKTKESPPVPINRLNIDNSSTTFRQFLSQAGYLSLEHREKLKQLSMTEAFLKDLDKLDALPE